MTVRFTWREPVLVGLVAFLALAGYEWALTQWMSDQLFAGYRFQAWSSNDFMQEVKIEDLVAAGPIALWYLHVQPPMLEALRLTLALPEYVSGSAITAQAIDTRMYGLYAIFYGVLLAVVFAWVRTLTHSRTWAYVGVAVVGLYPGTIAMATLLDGTFPSAVMTTVMLYLLYLAIRFRSVRLLNWWLVSLLILSLTRTIFQLQILIAIPIVVVLLYRFRMAARTAGAIALSVVLTASLFLLPAKQFLLYDTTATTSFAGNHQIEVVSYRPLSTELDAVQVPDDILVNASQFVSGFNSPENIRLNYVLSTVANDYYVREPFQVAKNLVWGLSMNVAQAFRWTHDYSIVGSGPANVAAAVLLWTPPTNYALSILVYSSTLLIMIMSMLYAFGLRGLLRRVRTYAAFIFVLGAATLTFLLANRYDWTEADRLKYVVVPTLLVITVSSIAWAAYARRSRLTSGERPLESAETVART